jgi:arabinogalactan endo-1,4-beta-galactosidase
MYIFCLNSVTFNLVSSTVYGYFQAEITQLLTRINDCLFYSYYSNVMVIYNIKYNL